MLKDRSILGKWVGQMGRCMAILGRCTLESLKAWWDKLCNIGPQYGYYPNPSKTVLIVKGMEHMPKAKVLFGDSGIKFSSEGERHLGAVIGTSKFKETYVKTKVDSWVLDVKQLASIGEEEPQLAYSGFTKGLCHRWKYVQRTIAGIGHLFQPLENAIRDVFIPAIVGRKISDADRTLFALPLRYGGLGIQDPTETSDEEFYASCEISEELTTMILKQNTSIDQLDKIKMKTRKAALKQRRETQFKEVYKSLYDEASNEQKKSLEMSCEKGSYSWLSALPLQSLGYILNKGEFRDAICLRYNWTIPNVHETCGGCGRKNDINHALICKTGGYVSFRHDALKDTEADLLRGGTRPFFSGLWISS